MKISAKTVAVLAVPLSVVCFGLLYQHINEQKLLQSVQTWQGAVATANFIGKSPPETLAFLNQRGAVCEPYFSGDVIDDQNHTRQKEGFVTAHVGPVARTFVGGDLRTWYITVGFNFDSHDKCTSSIVTWGPDHWSQ